MVSLVSFVTKNRFQCPVFVSLFSLLILISLTCTVNAVLLPQSLDWRKSVQYGKCNHAIQTLDGGYAVAATNYDHHETSNIIKYTVISPMLIKTNSNGWIEWNKTYDLSSTANSTFNRTRSIVVVDVPEFNTTFCVQNYYSNDLKEVTGVRVDEAYGRFICETADGGYVLIGSATWELEVLTGQYHTMTRGKIDVFFMIKTDNTGKTLWKKAYAPFSENVPHNLVERSINAIKTKDGGYAIVGISEVNRLAIVKVDSMGNLEWNKTSIIGTYGLGHDQDAWFSITEESDGGFLLGGKCECPQILKLDSQGNLKWSQGYQNESGRSFYDFIKTSDGSYLWIGMAELQDGQYLAYAFKADSQANVVWNKTFPTITYFERALELSDGNYVFTGYDSESGLQLVQVNIYGDFQWSKFFRYASDRINHIFINSDNDFVLVGYYVEEIIIQSWYPPYHKYWLLLSKIGTYSENSEFPTGLGKISVLTPQNRTYTQQNLTLSYDFEGHASWIGYSLDSQPPITINKQTPLTLPMGTHSITLFANDVQDVTGSSETVQFTIMKVLKDTKTISLLTPLNQTYTTTNIQLNYAVNEPISWVGYSLDSQLPVQLNQNTTLTELTTGTHSLSLLVTFSNGTRVSSESVYFTIQPIIFSEIFLVITIALVAIILSAFAAIVLQKRNRKKLKATQT